VNGIRHPFSGATYEQDGNGNVLVTSKGRTGLFRANGSWISGEIEEADPQLCGWVAGPIIVNHRVASSAEAIATAH
jgi:hypothetical protein